MSGITKGWAAIKEKAANAIEYVKIPPNSSKFLRIVANAEDIIGVYEHTEKISDAWKTFTCLGKDICPLCQAGYMASQRIYIPVIEKDDANMKVKIWKISGKANGKLMRLAEELMEEENKTINDCYLRVNRTGQGLKTEYDYAFKGTAIEDISSVEIPDIESKVQPKERDELLAILNSNVNAVVFDENDDNESPFV